jgi:hypothetical protein
MTALAFSAAAIFGRLGLMHLAFALRDFGAAPRFFQPSDPTLLAALRATRTAMALSGRDYWSGVLGFHLSHSIGMLLFALLIAVASMHAIVWLKPALVLVGVIYAVISWRCWFALPTTAISVATILMALG